MSFFLTSEDDSVIQVQKKIQLKEKYCLNSCSNVQYECVGEAVHQGDSLHQGNEAMNINDEITCFKLIYLKVITTVMYSKELKG